jgi:DNA-binding beta-propeller fold protein YncE
VGNPGTAMQIDVSGDSNIGQANMGLNPTHAAILPNFSRVFVASAGSVTAGNLDLINAFAPAADSAVATGLGTLFTYSLPNVGPNQSAAIATISESGTVVTMNLAAPIGVAQVGDPITVTGVVIPGNVSNPSGYDGNFTITAVSGSTIQYNNTVSGLASATGGTATVPIPTFCSYQPDYIATTQNTTVFVANYGAENQPNCSYASTDSVAALSPVNNTVTNIAYLNPANATPPPHPVAMVETPNAQNLYVVNEGNNTVMNLSPIDLSTIATIPVSGTPVWAVARPDNQRVYVLAQGSGMLVPIDVASNTILQSQTNLNVGVGANFVLYDPSLNRLYVTNPTTGNVFVYSATGGLDPNTGLANDTPSLLTTIPMGTATALNPTAPCPGGCVPVGVAALPDGSRFYVASYQSQASCSDPNLAGSPCIVPMLTVFYAASFTVKPPASTLLPSTPSLSLLTSPPYTLTQYAVPPVPSCVTPAAYAPGTTRFRMFTTASADSSHVYVSICDAGSIADITTQSSAVSGGTNNTPDTLVTDILAPFGACTPGTCSSLAPITSFSITSNVVTFQAANNFLAGQQVQISGLGVGTYLNGQTLTVLPTGLSSTQFECNFTHANVAPTTDTGTATTVAAASVTSFSITNDIGTFTAINSFTPGTKVALSNFTSSAGTQLNGLTVTVLATGLSSTQFEANLNLVPAPSNVGPTPDTGTAVPIVPPQSPVFLLTGQ